MRDDSKEEAEEEGLYTVRVESWAGGIELYRVCTRGCWRSRKSAETTRAL